MSARIKLAIIGLGKIACDQHVPALAASPDFQLIATASPQTQLEGIAGYPDLSALLQAQPEIQAVALCTPPQVRTELARLALQRGVHVLLEKPPGVTVAEVAALHELALQRGCTLFAAWHSRHAAAVPAAEAWLREREVRGIRVSWKEDVRFWHPGQPWLWQSGGLGVFDPGINALSILTKILGRTHLYVEQALLRYPSNCATPIAATMRLSTLHGVRAHIELDFLQPGAPLWDIAIESDAGPLLLSEGGNGLNIDGRRVEVPGNTEYHDVYARFAQLIRQRSCEVDLAPLQLVADAFLCGLRTEVAAFVE